MISLSLEKKLLKNGEALVIGMDEAGRGPLAGPVAVGAVVFNLEFLKQKTPETKWWREVNDSKKLSAKQREKLYKYIKQNFVFAVGMESSKVIDKIGINGAIEKAAKKALKKIGTKSGLMLVDGVRPFIKDKDFNQRLFKRGDSLVFTIACASIMAKVERDIFMKKSHRKWPSYNFTKNKGYGTAHHLKTIQEVGPCPLHRFSFAPLKQ